MQKYTVKKGEDGKYKLCKKEAKPVVVKDKDEIGKDALDSRIKQEAGVQSKK